MKQRKRNPSLIDRNLQKLKWLPNQEYRWSGFISSGLTSTSENKKLTDVIIIFRFMIQIVYFTRANIFGIHEKIWLGCGRDRKPPDQKGKKKCLLGAPLPAAQTFPSMKSLLRWTKLSHEELLAVRRTVEIFQLIQRGK